MKCITMHTDRPHEQQGTGDSVKAKKYICPQKLLYYGEDCGVSANLQMTM